MKQKIIKYFNQGAVTYDTVATVQEYAAQQLVRYFKDSMPQEVLEVGCGTGLFSQYMIQELPAATFYLTDIAPAMIAACQQRFSNYKNVKILCVDAETFHDKKQYDLIASNFVMHWFDDIKNGIENLMEKLLPKGKLIFSILGDNSFPEWEMLCTHHNIPVTTRRFPKLEKLQQQFPNLKLYKESFQVNYKSAHDFLHTFKLLGGRASDSDKVKVSTKALRKIFRVHSDSFVVSYEIIYGICEK